MPVEAMERARSVPTRGAIAGGCNPFYSDRLKTECALEAARPLDLSMGYEEEVTLEG